MGCGQSKEDSTKTPQNSAPTKHVEKPVNTAAPIQDSDTTTKKDSVHSEVQDEISIKDKENLVNLVVQAKKRENVFNHGYDVNELSYTNNATEKTPAQAQLIRTALTDNFIFAGIGDEEVNLLVKAMGIQQVEKGESIITEGDEGDYFYIIASGNFTVIKGKATVITLTTGKSFGELALMSNTPRLASVRAETAGVLYTLDRDTFRFILAQSSAARIQMITKALSKVPLLSGLRPEEFQKIADSVEVVKYSPGDYIIKKGAEGDIFYIIQEGKVKVTDIGTASQYTDHELEPGSFFGERALITGEPRTANVIAVTNVQLLALDRHSFNAILGPLREVMEFNTTLMSVNNIELFSKLDERVRVKIVKSLQVEPFTAGAMILKQGEEGEKLYIIKEGVAKVFKDNTDLGTLASGQYFGELALVEDEKRKASVVAETACVLYSLDRRTFTGIVGALPKQQRNKLAKIESWMDRLPSPEERRGGSDNSLKPEAPKILFSELREMGLLGSGTFGRVSLVQHTAASDKKVYALKAMLKYEIVAHKQEQNVIQEKYVMLESDHPFILKMYATFKDQRHIYMLLEVVQGGELFSVIHTSRSDGIPDEHVKFYGSCIIQAVAYLHSKDIAYRDMKPENCLIDNKGYPKLVDFGFAKKIKSGKTFTLCGTPEYLAPEIVLGRGHNKAVDYWAFGILLFEMEAGYSPFCDPHGTDQVVICKNIVDGKLHFPKKFNTECKDLIKHLLKADVGARLGNLKGGPDDIMKHSWFTGDMNAIYQKKILPPWIPKLRSQLDTSHFEGAEQKSRRPGPIIDCSSWDFEFG
mmetsp:Transcript_28208/g.28494  ORF Transcript_28208/g.28494 Transcript_28208/m.28494 type:complete len:812 (+) Transcript_28208:132-2567(+)|eukprot:CAMPEP_0182427722 /NCGR_PEP_ID=MMETSP1167-20130531/19008_1 /TAXON_ID=2988 /ORGANISM="Mallomonas Sp, Strain CCMP3275" /LENGTH=811 /DNA_ID=CAMNT_0024610163 /DNA_START=132 /DNA_END=2567 /DNA_ORIENTATION=+